MARSRKKGADRQKLTGREVRRYVLLLLVPCVIFFVAIAVLVADALPDAVRTAYALADRIQFENAYCRRDIGQRALAALGGNG